METIKAKSLENYIKDTREVTNLCIDGKCTGCGSCCSRFLPLTSTDIKRIKNFLKHHNIERQTVKQKGKAGIDFTCPFLNIHRPHKKCLIYKARPEICRVFICNNTEEQRRIDANNAISDPTLQIVDMRHLFFGETDQRKIVEISTLYSLLKEQENDN